jgi:hypothetical protein
MPCCYSSRSGAIRGLSEEQNAECRVGGASAERFFHLPLDLVHDLAQFGALEACHGFGAGHHRTRLSSAIPHRGR